MLSQQEAKNLIDKVIGYSKLPQCEAVLSWTEDAFIRFANNGITTSGYRITEQVSISSVTEDKREGNAVVTELTAAGYIQRSANAVAVGNRAGLFGYHTYTDSSLTNTMRTMGGTSSGWASQTSVSLKDVNG